MKPETTHITSSKNPKIKQVAALQKPRERKEQNLFLIEGIKEIERAFLSGYSFDSLFFVPGIADEKAVAKYRKSVGEVFSITQELFEKLTYRGNSGGMLVTAVPKLHHLSGLSLRSNPLLLVTEAVEKPGNLGAILRTANAAGVDAVIVCDQQTDIYNPNVVRSSVGCLFTVQVAVAGSQETIAFLKSHGINIYCAALTASVPYQKIDFTQPSAIAMGTEATGLTDIWLHASDQNIIIPMLGIADSLNVSTSTAIITFEALRQRNFQK
jgi:RNA methyltransferase, TrmH family